jgi:hypothetical protein
MFNEQESTGWGFHLLGRHFVVGAIYPGLPRNQVVKQRQQEWLSRYSDNLQEVTKKEAKWGDIFLGGKVYRVVKPGLQPRHRVDFS